MKKVLITILIIILVAAAGAGYWYYRGTKTYAGIFLPNTTINGLDVEGMTPEMAEEELKKDISVGEITINEKDGDTETIPLENVIDEVSLEKPVASFLNEEDVKYWPLRIREMRTYEDELNITFDDEKLKEEVSKINALTADDIEAPQDAYFAETENGFEIIPEIEGDLLDADKTYDAIKEALDNGTLVADLEAKGCYEEPAIKSDDASFTPILEQLKKYENLVLNIDMVEATEVLDYSILEPMLHYSDGNFSIDYNALHEYTQGLDDKYHTYQTQRNFKTHSGTTIQVGGGGGDTYGFWLNVDNMTDRLMNAINTFETPQDVEASWKTNAMTRGQENGDIGGTYVEISISEQKLWFFRGYEEAFSTDVVTGKYSDEKRRTPTGLFCLLNKKTDHTMSGTYGNQFCHYFMVFDWTGCALHDAYWRSAFGGDIYINDGSHGCVNVPPDAMKQLFDMLYTGLPVIIY